jgi:RNA polymerase sigma factor (sigma-70 family)
MSNVDQPVGASSSDIATFTRYFETYRNTFYRIAYRAFRSSQSLAEDGVQDAFLRCLPHWGWECREDNFQTYVARAIIRLSMDHYRSKKSNELQFLDFVEFADTRMELEITRADVNSDLHIMLQQLSPVQRELFELAALYEMSDSDYAKILGTTHSVIKSRFRNGKVRLRVLFT